MRVFNRFCRVFAAVVLSVCLFCTASCTNTDIQPKNTVFYDSFDTVSVINDFSGGSQQSFDDVSSQLHDLLLHYHRLFDIYNTYDGVVNLAYINSMAGKGAVKVSSDIIDFLEYSKKMYTLTDGYVNVAMGAVLSIWHEHRTAGLENPDAAVLPTEEELAEAAKHCNVDDLVIDRENMTVELRDAEMSLDVGAIAKGYTAERLAEHLYKLEISSYALDIGGNLRVVGTKPDGTGWKTGIRNPIDNDATYVCTFDLEDASAVTSGGYERYYTVDGKKYHHIIDKDTLMPSEHYASVTVICRDSGLADALSTALFCMDIEQGKQIISSLDGVEAVWVYSDGTVEKTLKSK